jgi:Protein of unknown function (DUF3078)
MAGYEGGTYGLFIHHVSLPGEKTRMNKLALMVTLLIGVAPASAQQDTAKAPVYGWQHSIVSGLNLTQVAFTDWVAGGENALAWTLFLEGKSVQDMEKTNWANSYKFAFGQTRLGDQGIRKTDDEISLETVLTYKLGVHINPYAAATFKSQFAKGYKYPDASSEIAVSKFFDPAYLTQSVGVGYQPQEEIKTRLGFALREVFTSEFTGYADDPKTGKIEKSRVEGGLESVTDIEWKLEENLLFTSKLELFAPFNRFDEVVVRSANTLAAKVNKYVTVNLNVQLLNDKVISPRTQIKEALSIGLTYTLL